MLLSHVGQSLLPRQGTVMLDGFGKSLSSGFACPAPAKSCPLTIYVYNQITITWIYAHFVPLIHILNHFHILSHFLPKEHECWKTTRWQHNGDKISTQGDRQIQGNHLNCKSYWISPFPPFYFLKLNFTDLTLEDYIQNGFGLKRTKNRPSFW